MRINFVVSTPPIFGRKKKEGTTETDDSSTIISIPAYVLVGGFLAAGIIFRQYLEITSLRQTLIFLQETARG